MHHPHHRITVAFVLAAVLLPPPAYASPPAQNALVARSAPGIQSTLEAAGGRGGLTAEGIKPDRPERARRPDPTTSQPGPPPTTVTLLTGDRVTVTTTGAVAVQPGRARRHVRFQVDRTGGHLSVVPTDAVRAIRTGRVDRRLFDVTELVAAGYDDAHRDSIPLLVTHARTTDRQHRGLTSLPGVRVTRDLPAIGGVAVNAPKTAAGAVWTAVTGGPAGPPALTSTSVGRIWLDGRRRLSLDRSVVQIGAPAAYRAGLTGRGVTVAVLDSGVDTGHPDLAGRIAASRNFTDEPDGDTFGHGTHVASILGGTGAASGGRYRGVAPNARLLSGKVCGEWSCVDSAILAGMQWAAVDQHATVVNLSLGGMDTPDIDPLEQAVNTLTAQTGTLFVIAAGNDGMPGTVGSPSTADAALSVGAVDRDDRLADFSSQGPRVGDGAIKPEVTAPGVGIVAARATGTLLGNPVGDAYVALSGTSMATPHVAGAAALLAQEHPTWRAAQLKATLMASAKAAPTQTAYQQGAGRIDVARAIAQTLTSDPTAVSFGRAEWPHQDDTPVTRTVSYHNQTAAPVTVDLTTIGIGPDGAPLPADLFRASPARVTVPAGGQAVVTVTADPRLGPDGPLTGRLVAHAGSAQVTTPLALDKEVESYTLTVEHRDHNGAPASEYATVVLGLDTFRADNPYDPDGTAEIRLPRGRYSLVGLVWTGDPAQEGAAAAVLAQPELTLDRDTRVAFDARIAYPVRMTVPDRTAAPLMVSVSSVMTGTDVTYGLGLITEDFTGLTTGQVGPAVSPEVFVSTIGSQWTQRSSTVSPYLYALAEGFPGRLPTGFVRHYRAGELATVVHHFRDGYPGLVTQRVVSGEPDQTGDTLAVGLPVPVPGQRVEYHNTAGVRWSSEVYVGAESQDNGFEPAAYLASGPFRYRPGQQLRETWGGAPFGPTLSRAWWDGYGITRQGDLIRVDLPLHGDAYGHLGLSVDDGGRTQLYRNGRLIGRTTIGGHGEFQVPATPAHYRLEVRSSRSCTDLSTEVALTWTFRSGRVAGEVPVHLPVLVARPTPRLDSRNAAPAGGAFDIPVRVETQPGAGPPRVRSLAVDVSYDGGRTWRHARVRADQRGWVARVQHPKTTGYVSLRTTVVDTAGNTVTERIVHAYRLRWSPGS